MDKIQRDNITFCEYYYLYQYTDDIVNLPESDQFPGLNNYILTGILTDDDMKTISFV